MRREEDRERGRGRKGERRGREERGAPDSGVTDVHIIVILLLGTHWERDIPCVCVCVCERVSGVS